MTDDRSSPFNHINEALGHLAQPNTIHQTGSRMGWIYEWQMLDPQVQSDIIEIDKLLTQTDLSKNEVEPIAAELMIATAYNSHTSLSFVIRKLQARISVKRQGRKDTKELVAGTTPKISIPTTMQKVRRVLTGKGKEKETEEEQSVEYGGG